MSDTTNTAAIADSKKLTQTQVNYINDVNAAVGGFQNAIAYFHGPIVDGTKFGALSSAEQGLLLAQVNVTATAAADKANEAKGNVQNHLGRAFRESGYTALMCSALSGEPYQNLKTLVHLGLSKAIRELAAMPPTKQRTPSQTERMVLLETQTDMSRASATGKAANIVGKIGTQLARMEKAADEKADGLRGDDGKLVEGVALPTDHEAHSAVKLEKALNAAHKRALDCNDLDLAHLRGTQVEIAAAIVAVIDMMQVASVIDDTDTIGDDVLDSLAAHNAAQHAAIGATQ